MNDPTTFNTRPGLELMHRFIGKGKKIIQIVSFNGGLIVLLERGPYWFANINAKPRKIKWLMADRAVFDLL